MTTEEVGTTATKVAPGPPTRPVFSWRRPFGWLFFPMIDAWLWEYWDVASQSFPEFTKKYPNRITMVRAGFPLYGGIFTLLVLTHSPWLGGVAFLVIIAAYLTDALDGAVAEYLRATSDRGAQLDPILDKWAGASMLGFWFCWLLAFAPALAGGFFILATIRVGFDLILAGIAEIERRKAKHSQAKPPKAQSFGKYKATADVVSVIFACGGALVFAAGGSGLIPIIIGIGFLVAATLLAPFSIWEHVANLLRPAAH